MKLGHCVFMEWKGRRQRCEIGTAHFHVGYDHTSLTVALSTWVYLLYQHSSLTRPKLPHSTNKTHALLLGFGDSLKLMLEQIQLASARRTWPWHERSLPSPRAEDR